MSVWRLSAFACLALGALAACSRPAWIQHVEPELGVPQSIGSLPDFPAWSLGYMGKPSKDVLPKAGDCLGYLDGVAMTYVGPRRGKKVFGWAWDRVHAKPVARVLLVDSTGKIIGAGEGGFARPDVPKALASVTSGVTGWEASTQVTAGAIGVLGIVDDNTHCSLGH